MIPRLLIAAFTMLVFAAGFAARMWTEGERPLPPPPASLGSEFTRNGASTTAEAKGKVSRSTRDHSVDRADLIADIEKARPQIEAYRQRLAVIDEEFDRALIPILTSEQRAKYLARQKRYAEHRLNREAREAADPKPLSDEQILRLQQIPLFSALWSITVSARLERLDRDLKLEAAQMPLVREMLLERREKFLALVDSAPPPTITLSLLASRAQKLGEPAKPAGK